MKIIKKDSNFFPSKLKEIKKCPSHLYVEGNLDLLNNNSIAIIGSRHASECGKKDAQKFSRRLSEIGLTIVSGLAVGIDTEAHINSYNQKGRTIAVLGSGFNKIFPPENQELYEKILNNNGLIVSEYAPDFERDSFSFQNRNRIISGLSIGVLVIEAKYRSGTGITANYAREQKRPLFALPHETNNPYGVGTNRILKHGGIVVTDPIDILEYFNLTKLKEKYLSLKEHEKNKKKEVSFTDYRQKKIFSQISQTPISSDEIVVKTGYPINEVQSILFFLEIDGYIKKVQGGYVCM